MPRTNGAGGFTLFTPPEERLESGMYSKRYLKSQLAVALGGRVAEELIFGKDFVTTGASSDLQQATSMARNMVTRYGMSESLGPMYHERQELEALSPATREAVLSSSVLIVPFEARAKLDTLCPPRPLRS